MLSGSGGVLCGRGGFSVYQYQGVAANQGNRASFDRPMGCGLFFNWEHDFVCFCERSGIPLEYAVNADLEPEAGGAELLANYSLVLSVGHDECKCRRTYSVGSPCPAAAPARRTPCPASPQRAGAKGLRRDSTSNQPGLTNIGWTFYQVTLGRASAPFASPVFVKVPSGTVQRGGPSEGVRVLRQSPSPQFPSPYVSTLQCGKARTK